MVYKEAGIDDIVRGLTRSGWFGSVYEGRLPGTGQIEQYKTEIKRLRHIKIGTTKSASRLVEPIHPRVLLQERPLTRHKATFNAPMGGDPLPLDLSSMGKGQVWINGQSIGRYWTKWIPQAMVLLDDLEGIYIPLVSVLAICSGTCLRSDDCQSPFESTGKSYSSKKDQLEYKRNYQYSCSFLERTKINRTKLSNLDVYGTAITMDIFRE
ncbi:beta-galactosidase 3, partial [Tanacetum coccineum]